MSILAGDSDEEVASPLYATAVGLLMNAVRNEGKEDSDEEIISEIEQDEMVYAGHDEASTTVRKIKDHKSVFDKWSEKLKDFLDNAE